MKALGISDRELAQLAEVATTLCDQTDASFLGFV
jgi:hypothetical protein